MDSLIEGSSEEMFIAVREIFREFVVFCETNLIYFVEVFCSSMSYIVFKMVHIAY